MIYTETYTTFGGAEIVCSFGEVRFGTLSGITFSVFRPDPAPTSTDPRSFTNVPRGIAGSLIFESADFDQMPEYKPELWAGEEGTVPPFNVLITAPEVGDGQDNHNSRPLWGRTSVWGCFLSS